MREFNLAEELEKERKKNKELKQELKEANESITWWQNRYNAIQDIDDMTVYLKGLEDGKEKMKECFDSVYKNRIDKATEKIKEIQLNAIKYGAEHDVIVCEELLNILKGEKNE